MYRRYGLECASYRDNQRYGSGTSKGLSRQVKKQAAQAEFMLQKIPFARYRTGL